MSTGTLEERNAWLHQAHKLISICLSMLPDFNSPSTGGPDTGSLTLAMRIVVALTDLKGWKWVTSKIFKDAEIAVKNLIRRISTGNHRLYSCIRIYISKLDCHDYSRTNSCLQTDDHFLTTASAITIALRPFQVVNLDTDHDFYVEVQEAVEHYCVFLLTVPMLFQRLPTILLPALKHKSVLSTCLETLLVRLIELAHV